MYVLDFRFISLRDAYNTKYTEWSRIFEYQYVIDVLKKLGANSESMIHNSSWGFSDIHRIFKDDLDSVYSNVVHSDIIPSELPKTVVYDITQKSNDYKNYFDFVINVSTVEEVNCKNSVVIQNLFDQVKPGGFLIITFDYKMSLNNPHKYQFLNTDNYGLQSIIIKDVERFVGKKIEPIQYDAITPYNSPRITHGLSGDLRCGVLVIHKNP